jgi:hypothetical protein
MLAIPGHDSPRARGPGEDAGDTTPECRRLIEPIYLVVSPLRLNCESGGVIANLTLTRLVLGIRAGPEAGRLGVMWMGPKRGTGADEPGWFDPEPTAPLQGVRSLAVERARQEGRATPAPEVGSASRRP